MGFAFNPWAVPNLVAGSIALAMAVGAYAAAPRRPLNRSLAIFFVTSGGSAFSAGLLYSTTTVPDAFGAQLVLATFWIALPFAYLLFLSRALDPRVTRPLRWRPVRAFLLVAFVGLEALTLTRPRLFPGEPFQPAFAAVDFVGGPIFALTFAMTGAVSLLALGLATATLLRAPRGSIVRRQTKYYLLAFGTFDATIATIVLMTPLGSLDPDNVLWIVTNVTGFSFAIASSALLVGYGMLRYQLFDLDIRIKLGVRRGALAGTFLATFFVASQLVEAFAGATFGVVGGAVSAGLLLFALDPLQRVAERVADTTMPRVQDTTEYRTVRKREVYRAAIESAMFDGVVSEKERDVLATLQDHLGLSASEARDIERRAARP